MSATIVYLHRFNGGSASVKARQLAWQPVHGGGDHAFQHFEKEIAPILRFSGIAAA